MTKNTFKEILQNSKLDKESLDEIISIFDDINRGIIQMHRYAAEDFKLMRDQFKDYNRKAAKVSENSKKAFELICPDNGLSSFFKQMEDYYTKLENYYNRFKTKIKTIEKFTDELYGNIKLMLIPGKNLNQHISSLYIVFTNLKLYESLKSQTNTSVNDLDQMFSRIKDYYTGFEKNVASILDALNSARLRIESIKFSFFEELDRITDNIRTCREQFKENNREVSLKIPELSNNIQENLGNSNKIIIELQYHDIIRQKIEHVQEVHVNIIQQLTKYRKDDDNIENTDLVKYLMQVGDIARIQASQLLNANKEYEIAMDTISEELLTFSENMISIVDLCNKFSMNDIDGPSFCKIEEIIDKNCQMRTKLKDTNLLVDELYLMLHDKIISCKESFSGIADLVRQLESSLNNILKKDEDLTQSKEVSGTQARELLNDIKSTFNNINMLIDKLSEIKIRTNSNIANMFDRVEHKKLLNTLLDYEQNLLPVISKNRETISSIFEENKKCTRNITDKTLTAVRSVQYYDYFDKLTVAIIEKLNHINKTFNINKSEADNQNFKHLKDKYTMGSERKIHDNAIKHSEGSIELFDDNDESHKTNNAELF